MRGAARPRVLELLQHENGGRLAHHETVALAVEGPRCPLGTVVAPRQGAHRIEPGDPDLRDRRLAAAREHHVGAADADLVHRAADRHVGCGARRALAHQRPLRPQLDRHPACAHVGDDRRDRERVDAVGSARQQHVVAVLVALQAADAGGDRRAEAVGRRRDVDPGVRLRLPRRRDDHLREAVHPARRLALHPHGGVEVLQLAGEVNVVVRVVEGGDLGGARLAGEQARPRRLDVVAERADHAQPGDHDALCRPSLAPHIPNPPSTSRTSPVMNEASSEARKRTAPATSSGSATRPSGVFSTIAAVASSGSTSVSRVFT